MRQDVHAHETEQLFKYSFGQRRARYPAPEPVMCSIPVDPRLADGAEEVDTLGGNPSSPLTKKKKRYITRRVLALMVWNGLMNNRLCLHPGTRSCTAKIEHLWVLTYYLPYITCLFFFFSIVSFSRFIYLFLQKRLPSLALDAAQQQSSTNVVCCP